MRDGFIKIACATPDLKLADCEYNASRIIELIKDAEIKGVKIVCFPERNDSCYRDLAAGACSGGDGDDKGEFNQYL